MSLKGPEEIQNKCFEERNWDQLEDFYLLPAISSISRFGIQENFRKMFWSFIGADYFVVREATTSKFCLLASTHEKYTDFKLDYLNDI